MALRNTLVLSFFGLSLFAGTVSAQITNPNALGGGDPVNTIFTAVPFLRIGPDARSGAMGDLGIGLSPDANAVYWNTAKLAFAENELGVGVTYTPWLRELVNDIFLSDLSAYYKLDEQQAITGSLRYFSLGKIQFTDYQGQNIGEGNPHEYAVNVGYARRLSDNFSMGLNLSYIYSNLASGQIAPGSGVVIKPGNAASGDISFFYTKEMRNRGGNRDILNAGLTVSNIGSKITYTQSAENKDFIPTNLGIGVGYTKVFDEFNRITLAGEVNKLLVPTPDSLGTFRTKSVPEGIFGSFSDAPDGMGEEFRELMYSVGAEYWYKNLFAIRSGYFNEHSTKGNRKYLTAGLGIKYNVFGLNFSYLIPTSNQKNPLDNTLRFSLMFDFAEVGKGSKPATTPNQQ
ncbi:MAG TPA: type IX secretion system outer membrane channel protein PorV [Chitinophagales bacterium]|nr:type IX secretion system outer membrane channel protein PorV [Chitinophagales bacterium]